MTDEPLYRQRILTTLEKLDELRAEIEHMPGDTLLAVDVTMSDSQHTAWIQKCLDVPDAQGPGRDGKEVMAEIKAEMEVWAAEARKRRFTSACGTPKSISENIASMEPGNYRYTLERMPSDTEIAKTEDDLSSGVLEAAGGEFEGKSETEIAAALEEWKATAREQINADRVRLLKNIAYAQRVGLFSEDEWFLLANELIRVRFGADFPLDDEGSETALSET